MRSDEVMFKPFGVEDLVRKIDHFSPDAPTAPSHPPARRLRDGVRTGGAVRGRHPHPRRPRVCVGIRGGADSDRPPRVARGDCARGADQSLKQRLQSLAGTPGVRFVVLTDREGFLIETAGDLAPDADEVAGALASCLAEASDGIGRELGQGQLVGTILEYEAGTLLLHGVGPSALLAVLVRDQGALGKVRYYVRKAVPELARAL